MLNEKRLVLDWTKAHDVCPLEKKLHDDQSILLQARNELLLRRGPSPEKTGWLDCVIKDNNPLMVKISEQVDQICQHSDALVVIGRYDQILSAKAIYEACSHAYSNFRKDLREKHPTIFWCGYHLATDEIAELIDALNEYSPTLLVISDQDLDLEVAVIFRILKNYLNERFGEKEAHARTLLIADPSRASSLDHVLKQNYSFFEIPVDVSDPFNAFTITSFLPLAIAGICLKDFIEGAKAAREDAICEKNNSFDTNTSICYAGVRNILYKEGFKMEALCFWSPKLKSVSDWWSQLFAKNNSGEQAGILPLSFQFPKDLRSKDSFLDNGGKQLFATHLKIQDEYSLLQGALKRKIQVPKFECDDGYGYLNYKNLSLVHSEILVGTALAHSDCGIPTLVWEIPELNTWWLGYWMYTNMFACAVGNYARGVDPFRQKNQEQYQQNMLSLLGKPGLQQNAAKIKNRLQSVQRLRSFGLTVL